MQTIEKDAKFLKGTVVKASETIPADSMAGPVIEERELDGWNFTDSTTKGGFTHLHYVRLED